MTPRPAILGAMTLAAVLAVAGCSAGSTPDGTGAPATTASTPGLAFQAATVDGAPFDATTLQGSPVVLWFWAPWCTICRAEAADVLAVAQANTGDVTVVGVAGRGEVEAMADFVDDTGTASLTHVVDGDGALWRDFGVVSQPAFAFVSAAGDVEVFAGSLGEEALAEAVTDLVAAGATS